MDLMPDVIRARLLANGSVEQETDHVPVVKFFNPCGAATWLITELMPDEGDALFGLCDLGMGSPELGYLSLSELSSVKGALGLPMERDLHFAPRFPLSVYTAAARIVGRITEDETTLYRVVLNLGIKPLPKPEISPDRADKPRR
jgi:hypothetical protein